MFGKKDKEELVRGKFLADMTILLALAVLAMVVLASLAQLKNDEIDPASSYNFGILSVLQQDKHELDVVINKVREKIDLPWAEKPILINIDNPDSFLGAGKFYELARVGSKILFYPKSAVIILYDPIENKVLNYGRMDIKFVSLRDKLGQEINSSLSLPVVEESIKKEEVKPVAQNLKVAIINGSQTKGLASKTAKILAENKNFEVVEVGNAGKFNYTENLVVDLSGGGKETVVADLAKILEAKVVKELPKGEKQLNKDAEIMVILGNK